ncbi:MAG: glycosyltransferase [Candidatus Omnitrophica bacterium]|nr:glycosyltransferase [Candidatus Omnitrophota bacterium]
MRVSVVVCTYNREQFILKCLDSLLIQSFKNYEIIIVDDGSTDRTQELLRPYQGGRVIIKRNPENKGLMFSRNLGASLSSGEIIAFTDSDCVTDNFWLEELVKPFSDDQVVIVGGRIIDPPAANYWEFASQDVNFISNTSGTVQAVIGCNMAVRKNFLMNNKFDEKFKYGADDLDLCLNCGRQGFKVYYHDKAVVTHFHRNTFRDVILQQYRYGFTNAYASIKNQDHKFFISYALWCILIAISYWGIKKYRIPDLRNAFCFFIVLYLASIAISSAKKQTHSFPNFVKALPGIIIRSTAHSWGKLSYSFLFLISVVSRKERRDS